MTDPWNNQQSSKHRLCSKHVVGGCLIFTAAYLHLVDPSRIHPAKQGSSLRFMARSFSDTPSFVSQTGKYLVLRNGSSSRSSSMNSIPNPHGCNFASSIMMLCLTWCRWQLHQWHTSFGISKIPHFLSGTSIVQKLSPCIRLIGEKWYGTNPNSSSLLSSYTPPSMSRRVWTISSFSIINCMNWSLVSPGPLIIF